LQIYVGLCFLILVIGRIVNFLTPLQFGIVVETLQDVISGGDSKYLAGIESDGL
jgi:hypothetical protein